MGNARPSGPGSHMKEITGLLRDNSRRHRIFDVFSDWVELMALTYSNAVDKANFEAREARYLEITRRYEREEIDRFVQMMGLLALWAECGYGDLLGELFMSLELGDAGRGQFFTPYSVCSLMAGLTLGSSIKEEIESKGFVTISEPAVGAGAMVIALAEAMLAMGVNYQQAMHVTAVDVDRTAVHMAYVQCTLFHVPGIIIHGNSLTVEEWAHWVTPAHVMGGWDFRLAWRARREASKEISVPATPAAAQAVPALPPPTVVDLVAARSAIAADRAGQLNLFG